MTLMSVGHDKSWEEIFFVLIYSFHNVRDFDVPSGLCNQKTIQKRKMIKIFSENYLVVPVPAYFYTPLPSITWNPFGNLAGVSQTPASP
mmetsp:Transcript_37167/g.54695  ORF Transcript_37167/g.54695 Transcript_37167/m.54695 type:complete len:89 (-) Transcript_37167:916-1182(-)